MIYIKQNFQYPTGCRLYQRRKRLRGLICRLKRRIICGIFRRLILTNWLNFSIKRSQIATATVFGKSIAQVLGDGGNNRKGTTKVFASESLGDKEIYDYAQSLAGGLPLKEVRNSKGIVYYAKFEGKIINLRNYFTSAQESKARWMTDIIGNKDINKISNLSDKNFEMKFR